MGNTLKTSAGLREKIIKINESKQKIILTKIIFAQTSNGVNKTKKALTKRFKITKSGKLFRRLSGQNHYRAKKSGQSRRKSRKWIQISKSETRKIRKFL